MTLLYTAATGGRSWAPSSKALPYQYHRVEDEEEDEYRPYMEQRGVDLEEGSGDSDEILGVATGVSGEFQRVILNTSQGIYSEGNGKELGTTSGGSGKRKRVECNSKRKKKMTTSKVIADAISKIASVSETEATHVNGTSIAEVMQHVDAIDEIRNDYDLYARCISLLMDQTAREMFTEMRKTNMGACIAWLRYQSFKNG
ncbi:uncharacterized protein LOC129305675 [Prosopis cineraria]|uniref:uncharacterized protein LOC129305675 n=1 Tax=Prosopis cineraria TaxID=364024 RepID=UPI0024104AEE|nr:uncharacterized protein LOC129305675 [Prosopis cineraria]